MSRLELRRTRAEDGQEFELSEVVDKLALRGERGQQEGWKPERTGEIYSTISTLGTIGTTLVKINPE